jgi:hypothetical protein
MATTTNYGWTTPDDTDLVKDGAAAIRTLGSSVDTTTKALNPETTTGDIAYRSATANTNTRLALGTAGQVLTVNSGATAPEWAAPSGGGKVLQVVTATTSTYVSTASTTFADSGVTATITPTLATSKIMVFVSQGIQVKTTSGASNVGGALRLLRGATSIFNETADYHSILFQSGTNGTFDIAHYTNIMYLDSPATTSATTYKTQQRALNATAGAQINSQPGDRTSTITLFEIGA